MSRAVFLSLSVSQVMSTPCELCGMAAPDAACAAGCRRHRAGCMRRIPAGRQSSRRRCPGKGIHVPNKLTVYFAFLPLPPPPWPPPLRFSPPASAISLRALTRNESKECAEGGYERFLSPTRRADVRASMTRKL